MAKPEAFAAALLERDTYGGLQSCSTAALAVRKDPMGAFLAVQWEWLALDAEAASGDGGMSSAWCLLVYKYRQKALRPRDETTDAPEFIDARK